ncbi:MULTISPECIES: TetR/AcrR family transcriptional regulator [Gordonia]|jgi:TetR/AcrR family transcriptional repressor of lmrAB and yxaGH operons|nr:MULTISPECIES: TetR/AcrR family transcriptional regulator [Gordonia]MBD0021892.1 TetR/AcrR family transcriptional regulator [Gordonia sp. (in: high G+C Gram-positive bacteria)]
MAATAGVRTPRAPDRMVTSAVALLSESGPRSVTIDRVLRDSGAPRGSVYHHFPGGREEIVDRATQSAADLMTSYIAGIAAGHTPEQCVDQLTAFWKAQLTEFEYTRGCPILATTVGDSDSPTLKAIAADAFTAWQNVIAKVLEAYGADPDRARSAATLVIAAVEGAIAMCKAAESVRPLDDVNAELRQVLRHLIG